MSNNTLSKADETWTDILRPKSSLFELRLRELWNYRDLVMMFVRRDFVSNYKQTVLGPIWFLLQPLLTTITFVVIFGRIANISTDSLPPILFYMAGIVIWNYFAETLNKTASTFKDNAQIFGKVYFPRLTMPFSIVVSNLIRFGIQFMLFLIVWAYYYFTTDAVHPNGYALLTPVLVVMMGLLALGLGMFISSMTTKYKDLIFLLTFGIQLLMYATTVVYPLSSVPAGYKWLLLLNPMTAIIEAFRFGFLGQGEFQLQHLLYSAGVIVVILFIGILSFNKVEKSFTDTI